MNEWLEPVARVLADRAAPATIFFRDDDVGVREESLLRLVDLFMVYRTPLDLAAIPVRLEVDLVMHLKASGARLGWHQHGWSHVNHERSGRRCEFGPARDAELQRADLRAGRNRLARLLGDALDPFFTPPWNRCTQATVDALRSLGFAMLSRNSGAAPLELDGLPELPIDVDWSRLERPGEALAAAIHERGRCGVMLHHAAMNEAQISALEELLDLVARHPRVQCRLMREVPLNGGRS